MGGDDTLDSDADRTSGQTGIYTLVAGETNDTVDAGMMTRASIGDRVWVDMNDDGIQDGGENGIDNITVNLLDESGTQVDTQLTNITGNYLFTGLVPGSYAVQFVLPSTSYEFSDLNAGSDPAHLNPVSPDQRVRSVKHSPVSADTARQRST